MNTAFLLGDEFLIGGQFAGDGSVITIGTHASENRSLLSCVSQSTVHEASPHLWMEPKRWSHRHDQRVGCGRYLSLTISIIE